MQLWITAEEAAPYTPWKSRKNIYERIRQGKFPFAYKRSGRSILIFAPDLGVTATTNGETQDRADSLATEAQSRA